MAPGALAVVFAVVVAVAGAGCGAAPPSQTSVPTAATPTSGASAGASPSSSVTSQPSGTPQATPSGTAGPTPGPIATPDLNAQAPLPEPSLTEPFDIAAALFDPARVADGVVSMLDVMGVAIHASDGTLLRAGEDRGAGELWLTEGEVRGLIEMTEEDLPLVGEFGGPFPIADMYAALAPALPGYSIEEFTAAYDEAYAADPESLAAQVMFGQPIDPQTGLFRVQMWLLLIDGFVGPGEAGARQPAVGAALPGFGNKGALAGQLPPGRTVGAAQPYQPPLVSQIPGMSDADWAALMARLPTLAYTITFVVEQSGNVHEGHGGRGNPVNLTARIDLPFPLISRGAGTVRVLLEPWGVAPQGVAVTWNSLDLSTLAEHGQLNGNLGTPMLTDASGSVRIGYTPKEEEANGHGTEVYDAGSVYAEVDQFALVVNSFQLGAAAGEARLLITGTRIADNPLLLIAWHETDYLELRLANDYNVTLNLGLPELSLHRAGIDIVQGRLARRDDGTYRGTLFASTVGDAEGKVLLGLAGRAECRDHSEGTQLITVVGRPVPGSTANDPDIEPIQTGALSGQDLALSFYPGSVPDGDFPLCQPTIPYFNDAGEIVGMYLPFNDTRWSSPAAGYKIHLPASGTLTYEDRLQVAPEVGVEAIWYVTVTRPPPPP